MTVKIPFDSLTLAAVVAEAQGLIGARLERIIGINELSVVFGFYSGKEQWLLISADPLYSRAHLVFRRPEGVKPPPSFVVDLKRHLQESHVAFVRQRGLDRILEMGLVANTGTYQLVAELMGKHANIILVREDTTVVASAKRVGPSQSKRPVLPGRPYEPPPFEPMPSLLSARADDDLAGFEGASPFLRKLIEAGCPLTEVQEAVRYGRYHPVYSPGNGAYPLSLEPLGIPTVRRETLSVGLEQHFEDRIAEDRLYQSRRALESQLQRVLLAREVALQDVDEALDAAKNARSIQQRAELVLAYQGLIKPGDTALEAWDYEGSPVSIPLNPELNASQNADKLFAKAKRAKARAQEMAEQHHRLLADHQDLLTALASLAKATALAEVQEVQALADSRKWSMKHGQALPKEERPFQGFAIRELLSPAGWRVLYGENATSNDHLTTKLARPSDLWFHVRGAPSAHVVLCTNNQPLRVQRTDLEFAAKLAVRHSPSKHSGYVSVDYTQKRYVRKPRGAAPGFALYTHEKTLHVSEP